MRALLRTIVVLLSAPLALSAQVDWTTVQQPALWLNTFVDHAVTRDVALWFDGHWRRDGIPGANPQQVLLRPGVQLTLRDGLRAGAGYAYIATSPYGESPNPQPLREHRAWQQLTLAHEAGGIQLSHRLRSEQRWTGAVTPTGDLDPLGYQARLRYLLRVQRPIAGFETAAGPVVGFVANEFFLPVGHSDAAQRRLQNRAQAGVGLPLGQGQRLEVSYLQQWNRITPRRTHEVNHTLVLGWVWTRRVEPLRPCG